MMLRCDRHPMVWSIALTVHVWGSLPKMPQMAVVVKTMASSSL